MRRAALAAVGGALLLGPTSGARAEGGLAGVEAAAAAWALAALPAELRAGLDLGVAPGRCPTGEPSTAVAVDAAAGRIRICAGGGAGSVRQQVLLGALAVADARAGWSREPAWRRLNGWSRARAAPWRWSARNLAEGAYAAPAGQRSPAWDLATFAAAWIEARTLRPAGDRGDLPLQCRLLPQATFLHARLRALAPLPAALRDPPTCLAYQRWAARERLARIELHLATPSTVTMASMFGHVFLRLVARAPAGEPPEAPDLIEDRTLAFLVESAAPLADEPLYALKGIAGAYQASLLERSFFETYRTYVVTEGRDLRRYHLHLSPAETEALLQRLWSLRQAGRYRYFFFGSNCATLMVDLVNSVLPDDRQVRFPEALATTPAGTLEGYARTRSAGGGPLLTFIPGTLLSFEHEARRAAARRQRAALRLRAAAPAAQRARHDALWEVVRAGAPEARAEAYRGLLLQHRAGGAPADLQELLRQSALLEAHLQALANLQAEQAAVRAQRARLQAALVELRARLARHPRAGDPALGPCRFSLGAVLAETGGDEVATRLRGYQRVRVLLDGGCLSHPSLADDLRRLVLLQAEARHDDPGEVPGLREAVLFPARERTLGEQRFAAGLDTLIDHPYVTAVSPALLGLQRARAELADVSAVSPLRIFRSDDAERAREEAAAHRIAVPRTGIDEVEVGAGLDRSDAGARGVLVLAGAMHDERLGDQRRFGFPAHTALTVARTETALAFDGGGRWPGLAAWNARLLGYRSLRPGRAGGELFADLGSRARVGRTGEARLGGGHLLPLLASEDLAHHLIVASGLAGTFDRAGGQTLLGLGAYAGLEGRLALDPENRASWFAARAQILSAWTTRGLSRVWGAGAELRLPVREGVRLPLPRALSRSPGALGLRLSGSVVGSALPLAGVPARLDPQLLLTLAWE